VDDPTHLVEEQQVPRRHEARDDLDAAALAVRDLVHVPGQVDVTARARRRDEVRLCSGEGESDECERARRHRRKCRTYRMSSSLSRLSL